MPIELGRLDEAHDRRGSLTSHQGPREQPVLATCGPWTYPHMNGIGGNSFWLMSLGSAQGTMMGVEGCGAAALAAHKGAFPGPSIPFRGASAALTVADTVSAWERALEVSRDFDEVCSHAGCLVKHSNGALEGGFDPRSDGGVAAF